MSTDSEDINTIVNSKPDEISSIVSCIGNNTFKIAFLLFILFIVISSDVFIDGVLALSGKKYTDGRYPTTQGVLAQGALLSLCYIIIHTLATCGYI